MGFEAFEGQGLRARLCCRRYLTLYFGYIILLHVDWPAQCLVQRKSQKKYTKRKDRKKDKRRKHFFYSFLYLLGEGTNRRYVLGRSMVPKTPDSKIGVVGSTDTAWKSKVISSPFSRGKSFFLFTHASSPFPLETSGSFFKFNCFLFIYLFFFLNLVFYLFICSLHTFLKAISPEVLSKR